jgi:hypothetical protein
MIRGGQLLVVDGQLDSLSLVLAFGLWPLAFGLWSLNFEL